MIAVPARHHMVVEMVKDPGSSCAPEVNANVIPVRAHSLSQAVYGLAYIEHQVREFVRQQHIEISRMGVGGDHQVTWTVRELVEQGEDTTTAPKNEIVPIGLGARKRAKNATMLLFLRL
jgi:hypothetical protein